MITLNENERNKVERVRQNIRKSNNNSIHGNIYSGCECEYDYLVPLEYYKLVEAKNWS